MGQLRLNNGSDQINKSINFNNGLIRTNFVKPKQFLGIRQIHLTAPQRLNAEDSVWLIVLIVRMAYKNLFIKNFFSVRHEQIFIRRLVFKNYKF